ncbi:MAG TPA: hypothetical protein VE987_13260 [Polyangiaceae bacterium]|nr:hypothetical protein [Polyangiaceae bacterium]
MNLTQEELKAWDLYAAAFAAAFVARGDQWNADRPAEEADLLILERRKREASWNRR